MYEIISNPSNKLGVGKVVLDEVEPCSFEELKELCELAEAQKPRPVKSNSSVLLGAMAFYLANDGSHGLFDAMKLAEAKEQVVALIGEPAIKAKQHRPF